MVSELSSLTILSSFFNNFLITFVSTGASDIILSLSFEAGGTPRHWSNSAVGLLLVV